MFRPSQNIEVTDHKMIIEAASTSPHSMRKGSKLRTKARSRQFNSAACVMVVFKQHSVHDMLLEFVTLAVTLSFCQDFH
eukprot:4449937-Amphidinium_carterae.1